jgi:Holliday junction resolvase RusA-like endonuclease
VAARAAGEVGVTAMSFTVPGPPIAWKRAGSFNGVRFTPKKMRDYQTFVRHHARAAVPVGWRLDNESGYRVRIAAYLPTRRCVDIDNIIKGVTDSLQARRGKAPLPGIVYDDDSRIVDLHGLKFYDKDDPRVFVEVEAL